MKLSDRVASLIPVEHIFCVSGGANLHLIHAFGARCVPMQTEAGAGFAADAYARVKGLGCACVTSGPGATNLITAIATSYYDSVPVVYITGQVASFRRVGNSGVRQMGFQETPIAEMVRPICKAVLETTPQNIDYSIANALIVATHGRKGPVVIDIADDYQREDVQAVYVKRSGGQGESASIDIPHEWLSDLQRAKRPVLVFGAGVRDCADRAMELADTLGIPIVLTWGAIDCFDHRHGLVLGGFGTHANRAPNFAVQNADYVIAVGARLDTKATGSPPSLFAREAKLVMVDIDPAEIARAKKARCGLYRSYCEDAGRFIDVSLSWVRGMKSHGGSFPDYLDWQLRVNAWARSFPDIDNGPKRIINQIRMAPTIVCDTGLTLAWLMQTYRFSGEHFSGERLIHPFNQTPMGYGVPGAIGAALATGKPVTLLTGDGGFSVGVPELATIERQDLPVDIHIFNNRGHGMCRQSQRQWLGGTYPATSIEGGLPNPGWTAIAHAYGLNIHEYAINELEDLNPLVKFGRPIEDASPLLDRGELERQMIVPVLP